MERRERPLLVGIVTHKPGWERQVQLWNVADVLHAACLLFGSLITGGFLKFFDVFRFVLARMLEAVHRIRVDHLDRRKAWME